MADVLGEVVVRAVVDYGGLADDLIGGVGDAADEATAALTGAFEDAGVGVEATLAEAGSEGGRQLARGVESGAAGVDVDLEPGLRGMESDAARAGETAGDALAGGFDEVPSEIDATLAGSAPDLSGDFAVAGEAAGDALTGGFDGVEEGMAASAAAGEAAVAGELGGLGEVGDTAGEELADGVARGFSDNIDSIRTEVAGVLATISALISAVLIAGVVQSAELDAQLREVVTLFGETGSAAEASLERLQPQVRDLSSEIGFATDALTGGLYNAISAGVPEDNVFDFLQTAGEFAVAGVTDVGTAIEGLTSATNAFNLDIADASDTADTFFAGVQAGKTTVPELSDALFQVAPAASAAGLALDETVAATAALTASGVPTSVATTQIRGAIVELSDAGSAVGAVFEDIAGVTFRDFIASGGDLAGALAILQGEAESTGAQVGDYFGSVEAAAAAQTLATDSSGAYASALEFQADRAGAAAGAFDLVNESASRQFELLKVQAANLASSVGDVFMPALEAGLDIATGFADTLAGVPEPMLAVVAVGGTLAATIAAVSAAALLAAPKIAAFNIAVTGMGGASGIALAGMRGLAAFLTGPWGIATAVAAAGFYAIQAAAAAVDEAVSDVNASVAEAAGDPTEALQGINREFREIGESGGFMEDVGRGLRQFVGGVTLGHERAEIFAGAIETASQVSEDAAGQLIDLAEAEGLVRVEADGSVTALSHMGDATALTAEQVTDLTGRLALSGDVTDNMDSALNRAILSHRGLDRAIDRTGDSAEDGAGDVETLAESMDAAESAGQALIDIMSDLDGGFVDLDRASVNYVETVVSLTEAMQENGATTDLRTEKGRNNISAILDAVDATRRHIGALVTSGATLDRVNSVTEEHIGQLRGVMRQAGFTEEQIETLIERYGLTPDEIVTQVRAQGVDIAGGQVAALQRQLEMLRSSDWVFNVRAQLAGAGIGGSMGTRAQGGPVLPDEWYMVGEEGPELARFGAPGMVYPADTTADVLAAMMTPDARPLPPGGGGGPAASGGGGGTQNIWQKGSIIVQAPDPYSAARTTVRKIEDEQFLAGAGDFR